MKKFDRICRTFSNNSEFFIFIVIKIIGSAYVLFKEISPLFPQQTLAIYHQLEI